MGSVQELQKVDGDITAKTDFKESRKNGLICLEKPSKSKRRISCEVERKIDVIIIRKNINKKDIIFVRALL